jgi:transposase
VITTGPAGEPAKETRTFGTLTRDLLALADWLEGAGVKAVAMEATGSYWKPIYNLLEDRFELLLANAAHLKAVPGRKTDVRDAEWIAELFRHGLLRASFIPARPERELRELVRYRTSLVRERASEINRIAKVLEGANVKLGSVSTNIGGVSGRAILTALVENTTDPEVLADLARGRLRNKHDALVAALTGRVGSHQRFLLAAQLRHLADLGELIEGLDAEIKERLRSSEPVIEQLATIRGHRSPDRRGPHRRDRVGHDPLPLERPARIVGRDVSGQLRERRHPPRRQDPSRQPLATQCARELGSVGLADQDADFARNRSLVSVQSDQLFRSFRSPRLREALAR